MKDRNLYYSSRKNQSYNEENRRKHVGNKIPGKTYIPQLLKPPVGLKLGPEH